MALQGVPDNAGVVGALTLMAILVSLTTLRSSRRKDDRRPGGSTTAEAPEGTSHSLEFCCTGPTTPQDVRFCSNAAEPFAFSCGNCDGKVLFLHKPTADTTACEEGSYPYAAHMHGRKRLWEWRFQFSFNERVEGGLRFGVEQDKYYWPGHLQYRISLMFVQVLRAVAGDLYQSIGDDPSSTDGEPERPIFSMPLWAMDQFVVTPRGEPPPSLADPAFHTLGMTKSHDRRAFRKAIDALVLEPGPTFSFSIWGISPYVDGIRWLLTGVKTLPDSYMCDLGINPPIHIVFYTLKPPDRESAGRRDARHLDSRKNCYLKIAFWSSLVPASLARQRELCDQDRHRGERQPGEPWAKTRSRSGRGRATSAAKAAEIGCCCCVQ